VHGLSLYSVQDIIPAVSQLEEYSVKLKVKMEERIEEKLIRND
jgi:hypothetical protein